MCGVAGLVGRLDQRNRRAVEAMSAALEHRGPDDAQLWSSTPDPDGWGCVLGHRRLSILDLSDAANQPMSHPDTGQTLVYNGEIYNFESLRTDLQASGQRVSSSGDTEVLLRLLASRGADALPLLRGMFAFGLWDPAEQSLLLARDPLGIKPLYLSRNPDPDGSWALVFASELRALLRSGLVAPRLDPAAVASIVWNGFVTGPGTAVRGVELLSPGSHQYYDGRGRRVQARRYAAPKKSDPTPTTAAELESALTSSVSQHLVSDVPIGVFLSSGVDSSAVANLAAAASSSPVQTFTLSFESSLHNEGREAGAIAAAIGTEHHDILLTEADFRTGMLGAIETIDQPTFDGLNSMYMARAVRAAGIKVALVGTGGDELFGGYQSFRRLPPLSAVAGSGLVPGAARRALAAAITGLTGRNARTVPSQTRWAKLSEIVTRADDLVALYQIGYALFLPTFQQRLLLDGLPTLRDGLSPELAAELRDDIAGLDPLPALSRLEQRCFLGERLLRDSDAAAMSVSLELRLPLVDSVLTEQVEGLPVAQRYQPIGRKHILRQTGLSGLNPALFDRPKRGFVLPLDDWLRGPLREAVGEVLHDRGACERAGLEAAVVSAVWQAFQAGSPGLNWSRIWALYVLVAWAHSNGVSL